MLFTNLSYFYIIMDILKYIKKKWGAGVKKRFLCLLLMLTVLFGALPSFAADSISVTSKAAIIIDFDTGYTIYEKNPDTPRAPASMTKIMSLYSFFSRMEENGISLDTPVTIDADVASLSVQAGLSNVPLYNGEVQTVDTLLKAACVVSANAAIVALGKLVGGSEENFVAIMNADAQTLGLTAVFYDASGLSDYNSITARSMAELCRRIIMDYPQILDYTSLKTFTFKNKEYTSTNKLLDGLSGSYPGTDGLKTGYIGVAGYCLCATSQRDGRRIIAVTMGSTSLAARTSDGYALLRYGFRNLEQTVERIYSVTGSFSEYTDGTTAVLSGVPQAFYADVRWYKNGKIIKEYPSAYIYNGAAFTVEDTSDELELLISVGPYNILLKK